jgi:hypothetical protein
MALLGRDVQQHPAALLEHVGDGVAATEGGALEVRVDHTVPLVLGEGVEVTDRPLDARGVDDDVVRP